MCQNVNVVVTALESQIKRKAWEGWFEIDPTQIAYPVTGMVKQLLMSAGIVCLFFLRTFSVLMGYFMDLVLSGSLQLEDEVWGVASEPPVPLQAGVPGTRSYLPYTPSHLPLVRSVVLCSDGIVGATAPSVHCAQEEQAPCSRERACCSVLCSLALPSVLGPPGRSRRGSSSPWSQCPWNSGARTRQLWQCPCGTQVLGRRQSVALGRAHWRGSESVLVRPVVSPVGGERETWLLNERLGGWATLWCLSKMSYELPWNGSLQKDGLHASSVMWYPLAYRRLGRRYVDGCVLLSFLGANEKMGV